VRREERKGPSIAQIAGVAFFYGLAGFFTVALIWRGQEFEDLRLLVGSLLATVLFLVLGTLCLFVKPGGTDPWPWGSSPWSLDHSLGAPHSGGKELRSFSSRSSMHRK